MKTVAVVCLGCLGLVSAWPQQSEAEIAAEAESDARIYKEMMKYDVFGNLKPNLTASAGAKDECSPCPSDKFFHACNTGGIESGQAYTCKDAFAFLKEHNQCEQIQSLADKCCTDTPAAIDEKCPPLESGPACTAMQESIGCIDGYRPSDQCVLPWRMNGKEYTGCKAGLTQTWCSHDGMYSWGSETSQCEECLESVGPSHIKEKWLPAMQSIRCLYAIATSGDANERVMTLDNGPLSGMTNVFPAFSAGKWPATVAIVALIGEGLLYWETKAADVFDWWTNDPNDARSLVTVHDLLSFTDGFVNVKGITQFTHDPVKQRCLTPGVANFYTPEECAKQIYETAEFNGVEQDTYMNATTPGAPPGTWFEYNSYHQNIALGLAVKVTGMDARDLLKKYVLEPAGMQDSYWLGGKNPCLSGFLQTTTDDYDSFLRAHTGHKLISKELSDRAETLVYGAEGSDIKQFGAETIIPFPNYAMGCYEQEGFRTMGGNIGNAINRQTGHYSMVASSGMAPYNFAVLMEVYNFHKKVEDIWANGTMVVKDPVVVV